MGQGAHDPLGHIAVEGEIGRKDSHVVFGVDLLLFKGRFAHGNAQCLGFVGPGDDTAVVIGQDHNGAILQPGIKNPLAGGVKIIAVNEGEHGYLSSTIFFVSTKFFSLSKDSAVSV